MTFDLSRALRDAAEHAPLQDLETTSLATRVRRRRTTRTATRSVLGVGLAGAVIATTMHFAGATDRRPPVPASTSTPAPSPTATRTAAPGATPSPTPTPTPTETVAPAAWVCGDPYPETETDLDGLIVGFGTDFEMADGDLGTGEFQTDLGDPARLTMLLASEDGTPLEARIEGITLVGGMDDETLVSTVVPASTTVAVPADGEATVPLELPFARCGSDEPLAGGTAYGTSVVMHVTLADGRSGTVSGDSGLMVLWDPALPDGGWGLPQAGAEPGAGAPPVATPVVRTGDPSSLGSVTTSHYLATCGTTTLQGTGPGFGGVQLDQLAYDGTTGTITGRWTMTNPWSTITLGAAQDPHWLLIKDGVAVAVQADSAETPWAIVDWPTGATIERSVSWSPRTCAALDADHPAGSPLPSGTYQLIGHQAVWISLNPSAGVYGAGNAAATIVIP